MDLKEKERDDGFRVPEGYFEAFPVRMAARARRERELWDGRFRRTAYRLAAAAAVALLITGGILFLRQERSTPAAGHAEWAAWILDTDEVDETMLYEILEEEDMNTPSGEMKDRDEDLIDYLVSEGVDETMIAELF